VKERVKESKRETDHVCVGVCVGVYVCVCVWMCVCVRVCTCIRLATVFLLTSTSHISTHNRHKHTQSTRFVKIEGREERVWVEKRVRAGRKSV
jgi:hypothetical protein